MTQVYSDPSRANDPHALPDVEVFHHPRDYDLNLDEFEQSYPAGWYYWFCLPGCIPDSEPEGAFGSEAEAIAAAQAQEVL